MKRRRIKQWTLWLLPLLVLRGLVPSGFMLAVTDGRLAVTFCPGVTAPAPHGAAAQPASAQHHHSHGDSLAAEDEGYAPCPFALVATGCTVDVPALEVLAAHPAAHVGELAMLPASHDVLRANQIRGPPAHGSTHA